MRMPLASLPSVSAVLALLLACSPRSGQPGEPAEQARPVDPGAAPGAEPGAGPGAPAAGERVPLVPASHPDHGRVEGEGMANDCASDADCHVGGCSGEICSAEEGVGSTCIARDWPSQGGSCGCVDGQCIWYTTSDDNPIIGELEAFADRACACADAACVDEVQNDFMAWAEKHAGARADDPDRQRMDAARKRLERCLEGHDAALPGHGQKCAEGDRCREGLSCLKYHGVAGARGPEFSSCEIPCARSKPECPGELSCVTISDGPGRVCR
jgi:eight-cysteine-cluster-containing protein